MIGMCVVMVVAVFNSPDVDLARTQQSAMQTIKRLAAAIPDTKPNATAEEQTRHKAQKAEVESLMMHLNMVQEVIALGKGHPAYYQNYLTVTQQLAAAGANTATLPEEVLCWHRAVLDSAAANLRFMSLQVQAGKSTKQDFYQARAGYERCLRIYRESLAELVRNAR